MPDRVRNPPSAFPGIPDGPILAGGERRLGGPFSVAAGQCASRDNPCGTESVPIVDRAAVGRGGFGGAGARRVALLTPRALGPREPSWITDTPIWPR